MAVSKENSKQNILQIDFNLIEKLSGEKISTCYQCEKCTNGCPMYFAMDIYPHKVMHKLRLSMIDEVLNSDTIWVCASCETCSTRCPNEIEIAHVMDTLRQLSMKAGVKKSQIQSPTFHKSFLNNVKLLGRMHEPTMALDYTLRSGGLSGLMKQMNLAMGMLSKGKLKIIPTRFSAGKEVKEIFEQSEKE